MRLVGYDFVTVATVFNGRNHVQDPEIIAWCRDNGAVWVHADDRARREHRALLQSSGIRTLSIQRERGSMSSREQLRILCDVLPRLLQNWQQRPSSRHYRAAAVNPVSRPSLRPETI